jgi:hypothetical protein
MPRVVCPQCEKRQARRFCPGIREDICAPCCGVERENSIECPFGCEYLREAREREKPNEIDPASIPNPDVRITDEFVAEHQRLIGATARLLYQAAAEVPGAIDFDIREALDAMVRTLSTLDSGLIYETRPPNPLAAGIQVRFQEGIRQLREDVARQTGVHSIRDKDVLGVVVFWQRMELSWNNNRRRGRAFLDSLAPMSPPAALAPGLAP